MKKILCIILKKETKDGKTFFVYRTKNKNNEWFDLKFRKEVNNKPSKSCYLIVDDNKFSYDDSSKFSSIWIHEIKEIQQLEPKKDLNDFFDSVDE